MTGRGCRPGSGSAGLSGCRTPGGTCQQLAMALAGFIEPPSSMVPRPARWPAGRAVGMAGGGPCCGRWSASRRGGPGGGWWNHYIRMTNDRTGGEGEPRAAAQVAVLAAGRCRPRSARRPCGAGGSCGVVRRGAQQPAAPAAATVDWRPGSPSASSTPPRARPCRSRRRAAGRTPSAPRTRWPPRAAVGELMPPCTRDQQAAVGQVGDVAPDRDRRDAEPVHEVGEPDRAVLAQQRQDQFVPFRGQHHRACSSRTRDRARAPHQQGQPAQALAPGGPQQRVG